MIPAVQGLLAPAVGHRRPRAVDAEAAYEQGYS